MNTFFRVDASLQIGTGHLMRCLTLANKLKENGAINTFICRHIPESLQTKVREQGHELILLPKRIEQIDGVGIGYLAHAKWLDTTQANDAQDVLEAIIDRKCDWLIVDHYALDIIWETKLRHVTKNILVIDDIADREHDCDVLLEIGRASCRERV